MSESIFDWTAQWAKATGIPHQAHYLCESTSDIAKQEAHSQIDTPLF